MRIQTFNLAILLTAGTLSLASCGGGGSGGTFTAPADTTPDAFSFIDVADVAPSSLVTSNAVAVTGIAAASAISVSGGEYSLGCGATFVASSGTVDPNQQVCVRHTSAATAGADINTVLTVGGVSDIFTSTTAAAPPAIALERAFGALSFRQPVAMQQAPGDARRWFVVEQRGVIRMLANSDAAATTTVFIDISSAVGAVSGELGLLNMAFDPDFASNGFVYLSYTRSGPPVVSYISRFTSTDGGQTLEPASELVLLTLPQPYNNHNGGQVAFGPDGYLYAGFGDGGAANDPEDRAQDTASLWGAIIRIDVDTVPYSIPAGNPFAGNARCATGTGAAACPEIFAWGLRNPWKFSFDRANGALYAGDVGQGAWEEVDLIENGGNYGWRIREGAHCNIPATNCPTAGLTDPVAEYGRSLGSSITGGYVYRGNAISGLAGSYVFGDFISGRIFRLANGAPPLEELLDSTASISSFAEDTAGELYVLDYASGAILRIVEAP